MLSFDIVDFKEMSALENSDRLADGLGFKPFADSRAQRLLPLEASRRDTLAGMFVVS